MFNIRTGDYLKDCAPNAISGGLYIVALSCTDKSSYVLINVRTGNRYNEPTTLENLRNCVNSPEENFKKIDVSIMEVYE